MRLLLFIFLFWLEGVSVFAGTAYIDQTQSGSRVVRKWTIPHIRWKINPTGAPNNAQSIIDQAFTLWRTSSTSTITAEYAGTTTESDPVIDGYCTFVFSKSFTSLGLQSNVVAYTYLNAASTTPVADGLATLTDADIFVNPAVVSSFDSSPPTRSLLYVLAHEIGHLYGLGHSFLIDSVMYPQERSSGMALELYDLFRESKDTLATDDTAWLSWLYPTSDFSSNTGTLQGRVFYNGQAYKGAHIIAAKKSESDLSYNFYPSSSPTTLLVKGLKNVSTFSEENGNFEIPGLEPGDYQIIVQDAHDFLGYSLRNTNPYLLLNGSSSIFPLQVWSNGDCESDNVATSSNFSSELSGATTVSVTSNKYFCEMQVEAHLGGSRCGTEASTKTSACLSSASSGGCTIQENFNLSQHPGVPFIFVGILVIVFSARRLKQRRRENEQEKKKASAAPAKPWL